MNQDLQKLIDIAKDGGAITPKQREIILKKAQELGEDLDEVEMVLESIQSKHVAKEPTKKNDDRRKCPNCGAIINDSALVCPECGYVLQQENKASIEARALIDKLQDKLAESQETDPSESFLRQASIVSAFSMPVTKDGLILFLEFAYSNYISSGNCYEDEGAEALKDAWYGKTVQAYNSLARLGGNDPEVTALLEEYSSMISNDTGRRTIKRRIRLSEDAQLILATVPIMLGILLFAYFTIRSEETALDKVGYCLQSNDFAGARAAARKANDTANLLDEISVQEVSYLIGQNNYEKARIIANSIEDDEKKQQMLTSIQDAENRALDNY